MIRPSRLFWRGVGLALAVIALDQLSKWLILDLMQPPRIIEVTGFFNIVLAWNRGGGTKAVLRGPGAYDGIVVLPNGAIIVSSHYDDALHVGRAGALRPLFARKPSPRGIGFDRKRNRLLIPSSDGDWLEAWTLPPMEPPATKTAREGVMEMARF